MAITDPNSVLILGAGASVPFGLPLGGKLIDLIKEQARTEIREVESYIEHNGFSTIYHNNSYLLSVSLPMCKNLGDFMRLENNRFNVVVIEPLKELESLLTGQTSETIDDFIAINPKFSEITKLGIATVFFRHLYSRDKAIWKLNPLSGRQTADNRRNWVHHLINLIRHHNFDKADEERSKVKVISFNYDGTLETILSEQFDNTEHDFGDWTNFVEIVHPHGFMGLLDNEVTNPVALIERWAKSIDVVKELNPSQEVLSARSKACEWIHDAKEIYMAGFALSGPNARMLKLDDRMNSNQRWFVSNYDGSPGLRRVVQRFERRNAYRVFELSDGRRISSGGQKRQDLGGVSIVDQEDQEGSPSDPLHIDTWFSIGVPGEMPA